MVETSAREALWTSAEAASASGGRAIGRWTAYGVSIDTRELTPGDLFVALKDRRDGHEFAPQAYDRGAAAALVDHTVGDGPALIVRDTLDGLRRLGAAARDRAPAIRVAVTGSVGKTSLKEAIALIFRAAGRAHWSERSFNNHWGAPLSLARMPRATERAVFELGMNHAREIAPLSRLVRPHIAVITKIAPAHIENLGSLEGVADAKAEIFEGFEELDDWGAAVIPGDDAYAERLGERAGASGAGWLARFGTDQQAEARLISYDDDGREGRGEADIFGRRVTFRVRAGGAHWGLNAAAALAAAYLADVPLPVAVDALAEFAPPAGRGQAHVVAAPGGSFTVIDDSYNANPESMAAALTALASRAPGEGGRRIAVLGEMRELGELSEEAHAALAAQLLDAGVGATLLVGEGMRALEASLSGELKGGWRTDAAAAAADAVKLVGPGDVVLVKGSNATGMSAVVSALRALHG